jgi:hypothetical protein
VYLPAHMRSVPSYRPPSLTQQALVRSALRVYYRILGSNMSNRQEEIVSSHYGINPRTLHVENVSQSRGGTLSLLRGDKNLTHQIPTGVEAKGKS